MKKIIPIIAILFFCSCKKQSVIPIEETKSSIKPVTNKKDSIEGLYSALIDSNNTDDCTLAIELIKTKNGYHFSLKTKARNIQGKAKLVSNGPDEKYILLEDIPWDEYEGDISNEEDTIPKNADIPNGIDFLYKNDTLTLQNYGNAMNYYTKLGECGAKYIQLVKK